MISFIILYCIVVSLFCNVQFGIVFNIVLLRLLRRGHARPSASSCAADVQPSGSSSQSPRTEESTLFTRQEWKVGSRYASGEDYSRMVG